MTKGDIEAIAEAVHRRAMHDACPECGALGMLCAKQSGEWTRCGVTNRPIKDSTQSWDDWLAENRGDS